MAVEEDLTLVEALRSTLERLVRFHGDARPWAYGDVATAAEVLALTVEDVGRRRVQLAVRDAFSGGGA